MIVKIIYLNYSLFYVEYFTGVILMYLLITYSLVTVNILNILVQKTVTDCLCLGFLLISFLILNEALFYIIDINTIISVGINLSLVFDSLGITFKLIITCLSFIFFLIISTVLIDYKITIFELLLIILFNILGLIVLCSSYNLMLVFISLELVSFSSYFLIGFKKNYYYSLECSLKYLIISTISGSLFLIGTLLFYYNLGSFLIQDINILILNLDLIYLTSNFLSKNLLFKTEALDYCLKSINISYLFLEYLLLNKCFLASSRPFIELGFSFILLSIVIKLGISPFHTWALEIYEKSTSIVVFLFILLGKLSYFILLFRLYFYSFNQYNSILGLFILSVALLSIIIGSFSNLRQKQIKTLLVYSSISHIGYILLAFQIKSFFSVEVAYFYLLNYLLSNIIIWSIILLLIKRQSIYKTKFSKTITDFALLNKTNKIAALGLLITLFSIIGLPPFIGFFSKFGILLVLVGEDLVTLLLIIILCTIISVFYYIRVVKVLYFENIRIGKLYYPLNSFNCFIFSCSSFILIFLFINPRLLYLLIHRLVLNFNL